MTLPRGIETRRASALFYSSAFALACSLLLGGGAANVYFTNAVLQILTAPCLILALWRLRWNTVQPSAKTALLMVATAVLLVVLQLTPTPPAIWTNLPFREKALAARTAIGVATQWAPISLTPEATIIGALALLPPLAIFLGVFGLSGRERRLLTLIPLAFGFINAFVGLLQLSQGEDSPLYFYSYSNTRESVGLFANRNHEAALLYSLTPFAAAWIGAIAPALSIRGRRQKYDTTAIIKFLAAGVTVFVLIVATLMAQSRAGVILLMASLAGSLALQPWRNLAGDRTRAGGIFAIVAILAMMLGLQFGLYKILTRFEAEPFADARVTFARVTAQVALAAAPLGTGLGSFVPIYASTERPEDLVADRYANHAHNDFLEFALETGVPGVALICGFLAWFVFRARDIWRAGAPGADLLMARAATLSIGLLLAHELVDYALRTEALLGFFAFACALLVPPPGHGANAPASATE
jgi:O-antigen ligase